MRDGRGQPGGGSRVEYVGIDTKPSYVDYATRLYGRPGVTFEHVDIHEVEGPFTKGMVMCTLQHLSDDEVRALAVRMRELVRGAVLVANPNPVASRGIQRMILRRDGGSTSGQSRNTCGCSRGRTGAVPSSRGTSASGWRFSRIRCASLSKLSRYGHVGNRLLPQTA